MTNLEMNNYGDLKKSDKIKVTKKSKKVAEDVRNLWVGANGGKRSEWVNREQRSYDFFLNSQLTSEEKEALEEAGMPTFVINRITPIIETMKFFVTAGNPRWKAIGVDGSDSDIAKINTDMMDYSWYISDGKALMGQVILDSLSKSKGYFHIVIDPDADRGMGEVKIERVDPFHVWVSNMSNDFLERDSTFHIIKKDLPREELIVKLPEYEDIIKVAVGNIDGFAGSGRDLEESDSIQPMDINSTVKITGEADDILPYYEVYQPYRERYMNVFMKEMPSEADMQQARIKIDKQIAMFKKELTVTFEEKKLAMGQQVASGEMIENRYKLELQKMAAMMEQAVKEKQSLLLGTARDQASVVKAKVMTEAEFNIIKKEHGDNIVEAIPYWEKKVRRTCVVGDRALYEKILNIPYIPLIPIPYTHTGTPMPMSAITPLVGKQQEINKAHQIMIHNANLSSNLRYKYVEGEINEDDWIRYSSSPGALLKYRPGFSANGPQEILPQNINNAFFTIEQQAKGDMEYTAGIQPPSMGIGAGGEETYRGFLAKDEYGTRRIKAWVQNVVEPALEHIGKVFQAFAHDVYSAHKVFRIVQAREDESMNYREVEINVPIYDDFGKVIGKYNDYATSRYDLRVVAGSTLPLNRWAMLEEYKDWLKMGVIDDIAFLQHTDIPNKKGIMKRQSMLAQKHQQVEQLSEVLKDKEGTIETLSRQLVQAGIHDQVREADKEIDRSTTETKMANKLYQERIRDIYHNTNRIMKEMSGKAKSEKKDEKKEK